VREDGIPSSNLEDGFSENHLFSSVVFNSQIVLDSTSSVSFNIKTIVEGSIENIFFSSNANRIYVTTVGAIRIGVSGNFYQFNAMPVLETGSEIEVTITRDGTDLTVSYLGSSETKTAVTTSLVLDEAQAVNNPISSVTFSTTAGNHAYIGEGIEDSDWLDQIGSNNGTVTGGEVLRIPAAEGSNSLDAVGGTLTNPAVSNGPHNDAETELDFYNIATDGGTTPAVLASGVAITDYTFGDSVSNPLFKRSISSVLEDRHTLFAAVLTGDCLETANEYTQ
jgi:hypothetical protein